MIGYERQYIEPYFASCELAGQATNRYNILNEESKAPDIFVCRAIRSAWEDFWQEIQQFG